MPDPIVAIVGWYFLLLCKLSFSYEVLLDQVSCFEYDKTPAANAGSNTESSLSLSLSFYILVEHNTTDISPATEGFAEGINRASEGGRQERRNSSDPGGLECLVNMYSVIDVSLSDESP